jgi:hypothetical protein
MPPNTVKICRPTKWGNPHLIGMCPVCGVEHTREEAVREFEAELMMDMNYQARDRVRRELAGKNLACWCPLDQPCHADVLLRVANEDDLQKYRDELAAVPKKLEAVVFGTVTGSMIQHSGERSVSLGGSAHKQLGKASAVKPGGPAPTLVTACCPLSSNASLDGRRESEV